MGGISIVSKMLSGRILQSFGSSQSFLNFENSICVWGRGEEERLGTVGCPIGPSRAAWGFGQIEAYKAKSCISFNSVCIQIYYYFHESHQKSLFSMPLPLIIIIAILKYCKFK